MILCIALVLALSNAAINMSGFGFFKPSPSEVVTVEK